MITRIEEIKLITRCVTLDDRRAFAKLVDEFSPGLRRFIFNLTLGDAALTDDIAQETFLKAYTSLRSFRGLARFRTWLYTIACRQLADYRRRNPQAESIDALPQVAAGFASDSTCASDSRHDVEVALQALTERERTVALLFFLEDRPIKEICRITGYPEGSVKSYISRSKTKMAKALKEYEL